MIPESFILAWQEHAAWQTLAMVEQDLIISRALVCLYNNPKVKDNLVFRGGTALNKLYINPPARYSEDIDFVQQKAEPIGETINAIRLALDSWLGEPKRKLTERSAKLIYQFEAVNKTPAKLKIEINTTEHFQVQELRQFPFNIESDWFSGQCTIATYQLEELMATKLRALYQRRKGRDLFDLWLVFSTLPVSISTTLEIFQQYCRHDNIVISKELFIDNLMLKRAHKDFGVDMNVLLPGQAKWDFDTAFTFVMEQIISKI